jgi:hypothetical protein
VKPTGLARDDEQSGNRSRQPAENRRRSRDQARSTRSTPHTARTFT